MGGFLPVRVTLLLFRRYPGIVRRTQRLQVQVSFPFRGLFV